MKKVQALWIVVAALLGSARLSFGAFEDQGAGARVPGMGNAFTAVADDLYAIYYNPAGLATLKQPQASASYSRLVVGLSDSSELGLSQLAYAHPIQGGAWGTAGASWQRFALNDLYSENTFLGSYGAEALGSPDTGRLYWGVNLKYLSLGFRRPPEAQNAINQLAAGQGPDPVLMGPDGRGAFDADFGLLYRSPLRYSVGLAAKSLMRPNVAFSSSDSDKLPISFRLGFGFKSLWLNLTAEGRLQRGPGGQTDKEFAMAAERYFPTLDYGQFGLRTGLNIASRDFKQLTAGLAYRINKMQFDYAFLMPFGTVKGTAGSHRLALTFHFGAPTAEEEFSLELLEKLQRAKREPEDLYAYEFEALKAALAKDKNLAAVIKDNLRAGNYAKALKYMEELVDASSPGFIKLKSRLALVVRHFTELSGPDLDWERELSRGILEFLLGRDQGAINSIARASGLHPAETEIAKLLAAVESVTGYKAEAPAKPAAPSISSVDEKLESAGAALQARDTDGAISLLQSVLKAEPDNPLALTRLGTAYYLKRDLQKAIAAWKLAIQHEEDAKNKRTLRRALSQAKREAGLRKPLKLPAARKPTPKPMPEAAGPTADPREIERLYTQGVEYYTKKNYDLAESTFEALLALDPDNSEAKKALERIQRERSEAP